MTHRADQDVALIERYLAGDTAAFNELMRAHEDRVFGVCLRMLRDREAALDATQETFITVFRKADRFAGRSAFSTWLYRVAVNTCYDAARKAKRRRADPLPEGSDPRDETASDDMDSVELRPDIEAALRSLPEEFRAAVVLTDLEGPLSPDGCRRSGGAGGDSEVPCLPRKEAARRHSREPRRPFEHSKQ